MGFRTSRLRTRVAYATWVSAACGIAWYCLAARTLPALLVASAVAGALAAALLRDTAQSSGAGAVAGMLGALLYQAATYDSTGLLVQRGLPSYWLFAIGITVTPVAAALVCFACGRRTNGWPSGAAIGAALSVVVVVWFVVASLLVVVPLMKVIDKPAAPGTYGHDSLTYLRTYQYMKSGDDYYHALVKAAAGNKGLPGAVKDGQFTSWMSAAAMRAPYVFRFWALTTRAGGGILVLSVLLAALVLAAFYWAFALEWGVSAVLVPILLVPQLITHTTLVQNVFLPDWWAALVVCLSIACTVRRHLFAALALALVAGLFRDVSALWLALLFAAAVVSYVRKPGRQTGTTAAFAALCVALFVVGVAVHRHDARAVLSAEVLARGPGVMYMLEHSAARSFQDRFLTPASYLMAQYEFQGVIPAVLLLPVGLLGLMFDGRAEKGPYRWLPTIYLAIWIAFMATVGTSSSYWGQHYTVLTIAGCALLLMAIGRRLAQ